jgi:hypothetical protein
MACAAHRCAAYRRRSRHRSGAGTGAVYRANPRADPGSSAHRCSKRRPRTGASPDQFPRTRGAPLGVSHAGKRQCLETGITCRLCAGARRTTHHAAAAPAAASTAARAGSCITRQPLPSERPQSCTCTAHPRWRSHATESARCHTCNSQSGAGRRSAACASPHCAHDADAGSAPGTGHRQPVRRWRSDRSAGERHGSAVGHTDRRRRQWQHVEHCARRMRGAADRCASASNDRVQHAAAIGRCCAFCGDLLLTTWRWERRSIWR